jgi:hypothetical protein
MAKQVKIQDAPKVSKDAKVIARKAKMGLAWDESKQAWVPQVKKG